MKVVKISRCLIILISIAGLAYMFYRMIYPEKYSKFTGEVNYVFVPDKDEFETNEHIVRGAFWAPKGQNIKEVKIFYRRKESPQFNVSIMQRVKDTNTYIDALPKLSKGNRYFYYIEVEAYNGAKVSKERIPENAPQKPLLYVSYEGRPSKFLMITHIVLVVGAIFFLIHSLYWAFCILFSKAGEEYPWRNWSVYAYFSMLFGWLFFSISTVVIGQVLANQVFGMSWSGWPIGEDITDNKSLFVILYWGLILLTRSKKVSEKFSYATSKNAITFSMFIIIGFILIAVIYTIPHSFFFQD